MASRLLKLNRFFSWILAVFTLVMIVSGYSFTRPLFEKLTPLWFFIRNIHLWLCLLFTIQVFFHVIVVELFFRSKWFSVFRKNWRIAPSSFLFFKLFQKITGYLILIVSLLVILTGFNFYLPVLNPFFPLFQHVRLDLSLIVIHIIHIALGGKMVFVRKKWSNLLTNTFLFVASITALSLVVYVNTLG